jgi:hypothetical protein
VRDFTDKINLKTKNMKLLKWLFGSRKPALNKPVVSSSGKTIKSFVAVGDVIEVLHYGEKEIYKVEQFEVIMNNLCAPTEFVIHVKFSYNEGVSSIECTSDNFKYVRHISHCC